MPEGKPPPRKLHVISFGCQMSAADGDEMARPLLGRGHSLVEDPADADAILLNTCTVRQHAEDRALSLIGRLRAWKEAKPESFLIVAGCAAERLGDWIQSRFPYVDLVVGARSIERYPEILDEALRRRFDWSDADRNGGPSPLAATPGAAPEVSESSAVAAHVTIMRGCNYACSYCIVPAVRGRELYRPFQVILDEARKRVASGAREIMLLGQTVNSYRSTEGLDFADLLRGVAAVPRVERLRFMSPHPYYLGPRMIRAMAETPQVSPHLHLPVQSGSDRLLRAMKRNYTVADYLAKIDALRKALPAVAISTDLIAGFPGETEEDFEATLALVRALDPTFGYCFMFSPREGTEAASLEGQLPDEVKQERLQRLLELVEKRQKQHLARQVGRKVRVLLEDETRGRTDDFFHARFDAPSDPGSIVEGVVTGFTHTGLAAQRIN